MMFGVKPVATQYSGEDRQGQQDTETVEREERGSFWAQVHS